jgi:hypothetical protein
MEVTRSYALGDQDSTRNHWATSSARSSSACGISRPSAFAAIDHQLELGHLLDRKIGWLGALEGPASICHYANEEPGRPGCSSRESDQSSDLMFDA